MAAVKASGAAVAPPKPQITFVIPKNKLGGTKTDSSGGALIATGGTPSTDDPQTSINESLVPSRKTKWGPDFTNDPVVKRGRCLSLQIRAEQIAAQLESGNLFDGVKEGDRSPSPPPVYDSNGQRVNTREGRKREQLDIERREAIGECLAINPLFKPPAGYRPVLREAKIYIPWKEYPGHNFIGLILGPRGNSQKRMEQETGAKIAIRGKGALKDGKGGRKDGKYQEGANEDLHVYICADTYEKVDAALALIEPLLTPLDEIRNDTKRRQLRELAEMNGTVRDIIILCTLCGESGHREWQCPHDKIQTFKANIFCSICGDGSHPTSDCPKASDPNAKMAVDSEYMKLMAELGVAPSQGNPFSSAPAPTSQTSINPEVRPTTSWAPATPQPSNTANAAALEMPNVDSRIILTASGPQLAPSWALAVAAQSLSRASGVATDEDVKRYTDVGAAYPAPPQTSAAPGSVPPQDLIGRYGRAEPTGQAIPTGQANVYAPQVGAPGGLGSIRPVAPPGAVPSGSQLARPYGTQQDPSGGSLVRGVMMSPPGSARPIGAPGLPVGGLAPRPPGPPTFQVGGPQLGPAPPNHFGVRPAQPNQVMMVPNPNQPPVYMNQQPSQQQQFQPHQQFPLQMQPQGTQQLQPPNTYLPSHASQPPHMMSTQPPRPPMNMPPGAQFHPQSTGSYPPGAPPPSLQSAPWLRAPQGQLPSSQPNAPPQSQQGAPWAQANQPQPPPHVMVQRQGPMPPSNSPAYTPMPPFPQQMQPMPPAPSYPPLLPPHPMTPGMPQSLRPGTNPQSAPPPPPPPLQGAKDNQLYDPFSSSAENVNSSSQPPPPADSNDAEYERFMESMGVL